ncbi:hypothetical protein CVT26_001114 [Gymnopilus dilepis]|uniref:Uncharacterized protein n=1 Tax=Gymnopilus dilepis TaxID=231916 RepID=A0A409W7K6_9AGAR|nr:hypothetical protein CVT26_001114 [Gymnopilus dilepis]
MPGIPFERSESISFNLPASQNSKQDHEVLADVRYELQQTTDIPPSLVLIRRLEQIYTSNPSLPTEPRFTEIHRLVIYALLVSTLCLRANRSGERDNFDNTFDMFGGDISGLVKFVEKFLASATAARDLNSDQVQITRYMNRLLETNETLKASNSLPALDYDSTQDHAQQGNAGPSTGTSADADSQQTNNIREVNYGKGSRDDRITDSSINLRAGSGYASSLPQIRPTVDKISAYESSRNVHIIRTNITVSAGDFPVPSSASPSNPGPQGFQFSHQPWMSRTGYSSTFQQQQVPRGAGRSNSGGPTITTASRTFTHQASLNESPTSDDSSSSMHL